MTDVALKAAERAALIGGVAERATWLSLRGRENAYETLFVTGESGEDVCPKCVDLEGRICWPWSARLALAAYCGDKAALELMDNGQCPSCEILKGNCGYVTMCLACGNTLEGKSRRGDSFQDWLLALYHLPREVMLRAARAAAIVAEKSWLTNRYRKRRTMGTDDPRGDSSAPGRVIKAWGEWLECPCAPHYDAWSDLYLGGGSWSTATTVMSGPHPQWICPPPGWSKDYVVRIRAAIKEATEPVVREAVFSSLIDWALS